VVCTIASKERQDPRIHAKSHGGDLVPFAEVTRIIANNYKEMDDETMAFVDDVAKATRMVTLPTATREGDFSSTTGT
jgi:hypothetical protein